MIRKLLLLLVAALAAAPAAAVPPPHHAVTGTIAAPDGGWDLASVDPAAHRLLIARSAEVTVIDLASPPTVRAIGHVVRGHAAIALPHGRVLVTSGTEGMARILDAVTGADVADATVGQNPDAAIWDSRISAALGDERARRHDLGRRSRRRGDPHDRARRRGSSCRRSTRTGCSTSTTRRRT